MPEPFDGTFHRGGSMTELHSLRGFLPRECVRTAPQSPRQARSGGWSGGNPFGASPSNIFAPSGSSLGACSEEEARQQQPAMIDTEQARKYFQDGSKALFVDVRPAGEFRQDRIAGAVSMPLEDLERKFQTLPKDRPIVLYESGRNRKADDICASGRAAGRFLLAHGFSYERIRVYQDGLQSWEKAGLPVQHGTPSGS